MASTYTPIATGTSSGSSNGITFSSIPQTYTDLILVVNYRSQAAASTDGLYLNADNTSLGNFSSTILIGNGSSASSARYTSDYYGSFCGYVPAASTASGTFGTAIVHIMNYTNTTTFKTAITRTGTAGSYTTAAVSLLRGTGAITSVSPFVYGGGSNLVSGSTATLYGVKSA
jgi:hypothetical protein